ncbi:5375_t:CDS:1, partial [Ambispora gerdemannii]
HCQLLSSNNKALVVCNFSEKNYGIFNLQNYFKEFELIEEKGEQCKEEIGEGNELIEEEIPNSRLLYYEPWIEEENEENKQKEESEFKPGIKFLKENSLRLIVGYDTIQVWGYSELLYIWSIWSNQEYKDKKINSFKIIRDDEKGLEISLRLETDDIDKNITVIIPKNALSEQMTDEQVFLDNLNAFKFLSSICQLDSIAKNNQLKEIRMATKEMLIKKVESQEEIPNSRLLYYEPWIKEENTQNEENEFKPGIKFLKDNSLRLI